MKPNHIASLGAAFLLCAALAACESATPSAAPAEPLTVTLNAQGEPAGIEHHKRWSDKVGQGGQPAGDVAFRNIAALGYKTVLSVDGATPDVAGAAKYGLTYVHVPIEYSGITREQEVQIVKAVQASDGPVFIHCHHGVHRGPAAAMVARIGVEGLSNEQATADLKASGCSAKYEGLYRDVAKFTAPPADEIARAPMPPSRANVGGSVEHMAAAGRVFERLQACEKAGGGPPPSEPDVNPPHEAVILSEHFRELARLDDMKSHGDAFVKWLADSETSAKAIESSLRAGDKAGATAALASVKKTCDTCHKKYRDN